MWVQKKIAQEKFFLRNFFLNPHRLNIFYRSLQKFFNVMQKIKNVIFDLGNVIIDLDIPRTWQSFEHLLGADFQDNLKKINADRDIFIQYEIGRLTEQEFFDALRASTNMPVSIKQLKEAWNAMLLTVPKARLDMLTELKKKYNVYLLSNTNQTHIDFVHGYLKTVYNVTDFEGDFFHKPYYSHHINLRKPNADIYEFVLNDGKMNPKETIFFDDMPANIETAKQLGIQAVLHPVGAEIVDHVNSLL